MTAQTKTKKVPQAHRKSPKTRKWRYVGGGVLALLLIVLIVLRLYLSSWLLGYVNHVLATIPGYQGSVESINIDLYRGAYRINKLVLNKTNGKIPTPFIAIDTTDFSVQWSALLHGRVVASVTLLKPVINFAVKDEAKQTGADVDWTKPIKDLVPVDINYVRFEDGSIAYQDFASTPNVNVFLHQMRGEVTNLRNVTNKDQPLPSVVTLQGNSIGNGVLKVDGRMNILKEVPDMNMKLSLQNTDLPALNNFTEAYGAFDFKTGSFNLFSQLKVKDSQVSGYVKPVVTNLAVDVLKTANPAEIVWSSLVAGVLKIFTNPTKDQFATRVDLEGSLGNISTDTWSALGGILRNAFVNAMTKGFDETGHKDAATPDEKDE